MTWGPVQNYNNQFNGSNGWPNNGRYTDHDTTRGTWCADGKIYESGNDGYGPQYVLKSTRGRTIFLNTLTPFTTPAAGVLETLVNSMDDFGTIAQDVYSNGTSLKTAGLDCQNGVLYWFVFQQSLADNKQGSMGNVLK